jgi:hypothetical protein
MNRDKSRQVLEPYAGDERVLREPTNEQHNE